MKVKNLYNSGELLKVKKFGIFDDCLRVLQPIFTV